jgi:uncharacterized OB-fold protein
MAEQDTQYCFTVEGKLALPYQYFAGANGSKFIVALRDEKKILAVRSESTSRTLVPPREVDERTFEDLRENWVEVGNEGEVTGFTVIRYSEPYQPKEPPYLLALIKLDGADSSIAHILDCDPGEVQNGMRVKAVFADEPVNSILAVSHFTPAV